MITQEAIRAIRVVVNDSIASERSWQALLDTLERYHPSELWAMLPKPALEEDVENATAWISLSALPQAERGRAKGLYLGLDTDNMDNDPIECPGLASPSNVQIGGTSDCIPFELTMKWMYDCEWYADSHLVGGMQAMKRIYDDDQWPEETRYYYADYGLILGYSGIVMLAALQRIEWPIDYLAVWGFHDGDVYPLVRRLNGQTERLAASQLELWAG